MDFFKDIKPLTKYSKGNARSFESISRNEPQARKPIEDVRPKPISTIQSNIHTDKELLTSINNRKKNTHSTAHGLWVFVVLAFIALGVVLSFKYATATITISPKINTIPIDKSFSFSEDKAPMAFETVSVDSSIKEQITLTEKIDKKENAKGTVTFYNVYSTASQVLVRHTRLKSKNGLVYKTDEAVTVPGYTILQEKKIPGSITVTVTAEGAGEKYNLIESSSLSIVALSGTAKSESIYATVSKPISGGLDGSYFTTSTNTAVDTTKNKIVLTEKLNELIKKQIPEDYLYIEGLNSVSISDDTLLYSTEAQTEIISKGTLTQIVFPVESFKNFMLSQYSELDKEHPLDLSGIKGKIESIEGGDSPVYATSFSGFLKQKMIIDEDALRVKLAGTSKNSFSDLMDESKETIEQAELKIKPFWISSIPKTFSRITIVNSNDRN